MCLSPAFPRGRHVHTPTTRRGCKQVDMVSIFRAVLYFLGVSYRSSGCNEFISTPPPTPFYPPRSWRIYLCLCVYMYALTFRLRDFFIFAQSAYPSPFASEDAPSFFFSPACYFCPVLSRRATTRELRKEICDPHPSFTVYSDSNGYRRRGKKQLRAHRQR